MKLTDGMVSKLAPKDKAYEVWDSGSSGLIVRVQPSGLKVYYFTYRAADGARQRVQVGKADSLKIKDARKACKKLAAVHAMGVNPAQERRESRRERQEELGRSLRLGEFLNGTYATWSRAHKRTAEAGLTRIAVKFEHLMKRELISITVAEVEAWRSRHLASGIKPATLNRDLAELKAVLAKAEHWGLIDHHPLRRLRMIRADNLRVRYLTEEEERRLLAALVSRDRTAIRRRRTANAWRLLRGIDPLPEYHDDQYVDFLHPLVLMSLHTGLRKGEALSLRWADVVLEESANRITVRPESAKSGRVRHVPLSATARAALVKWKRESPNTRDLVFCAEDGQRIRDPKKSWASLLEDA